MEEKSTTSKSQSKREENIKVYQETCSIIKHYSTLSYNVRALVVAQGFVLIGAWILNFEKPSSNLNWLIPVFGIVFTCIFFLFYRAYNFTSANYYKLISEMEEELFDDKFRPFQSYRKSRETEYKNCIYKWFTLHAPFTFTFIVFLIAFIFSLYSKLSY